MNTIVHVQNRGSISPFLTDRPVRSFRFSHRSAGFTLVELLIVIVIIAILAAITVVAYNGIQNRARTSAVSAALNQVAKKVMQYNVENGSYPATLAAAGISDSSVTYQYTSTTTSFCITGTQASISEYISDTNPSPTSGGCPGHGVGGVAAITNLATNPSFESGVTKWTAANAAKSATTSWGNTGTASMLLTPDGVSVDSYAQLGDYDNATFALQPSTQYTLSAYGKVVTAGSGATTTNGVLQATMWINDGTTYQVYRGTQLSNTAGSVGRSSITFTTPSTVLKAFIRLYCGYTNGSLMWDSVMLTQGSTLYNYADGSSPSWVWNGTANISSSTGPPV